MPLCITAPNSVVIANNLYKLEATVARARVFVADSAEVVRIGIKSLLTQCGGYEICGEAADGRTTVEQTKQLRPDVVVLDIFLPRLNGLEATTQILAVSPPTSVLLFADTQSPQIMHEALQLGVTGFVSKSDRMSDLLSAVHAVLRGNLFFSSRVTQMFLRLKKQLIEPKVLTLREREVVQLIAEGNCVKDIARMLATSNKTVETHRSNAMRKLDIHSTARLILYAVQNGIVHIHKPILQSIGEHWNNADNPRPPEQQYIGQ